MWFGTQTMRDACFIVSLTLVLKRFWNFQVFLPPRPYLEFLSHCYAYQYFSILLLLLVQQSPQLSSLFLSRSFSELPLLPLLCTCLHNMSEGWFQPSLPLTEGWSEHEQLTRTGSANALGRNTKAGHQLTCLRDCHFSLQGF